MPIFRKEPTTVKIPVVEYSSCLAKSFTQKNGKVAPGRSVFNHCQIVGLVAREIIRRMPSDLSRLILPEGSELVAASHDIGKVCPTFYNKIMRACKLPEIPNVNPELEREWGGHAAVSQLTAQQMGAPEYVPEILGQHHGFSPNVAGMRANDEKFGGEDWQQERKRLTDALQKSLGVSWPKVKTSAQARVLAGLTSVSDWIGSGRHFENPQSPWKEKICEALDDAGYVPITYRTDLSFENVFGFSPWQAQSALIEQISNPGVYILEAPMGLGKTEAALYSAYKMLDSGQASGIYFALPTQLTSNKILKRFESFLDAILVDDSPHRSLLLHANAWLLKTEMGEEGRPGGAWFSQNKRGLLSPFAVGTIDQALMATMNVKHGFVRAFGLAGKVVILDEVHTYDAYTGTLLDALVKLLRQLRCTVIILSATLSQERRQALLGCTIESTAYPLVTSTFEQKEKIAKEVSVPVNESKSYKIHLCSNDCLAVEQALLRAEQGQQILWIENTVKEAQQRYLDLAARGTDLDVDCGLLHSRFTKHDRQRIEDKWVDRYGKAGWDERQMQGRILVGTQVLEQSLDIDADFMVSRFAPTDMLLQRLGRLWRHAKTPRCNKATPEVWFLAPKWEVAIENPPQFFGHSVYIYSPYVLCRSLEVWQDMKCINLPNDIRGLIEKTYSSRSEKDAMSQWLHELDHGNSYGQGRMVLQQLANLGLAKGGKTLPESKAQTRYSETDCYELLILKDICRSEESATLKLLNGEQINLPLHSNRLSKQEWRQRSIALMRQIVNVPQADKPKSVSIDMLKRYGLQNCFYLGRSDWYDDESILRIAKVDDTDNLVGIENTQIHDKYTLQYRDDIGYRVIKSEE